jgi:CubicO group peptidase (beta-lactamase class C family)
MKNRALRVLFALVLLPSLTNAQQSSDVPRVSDQELLSNGRPSYFHSKPSPNPIALIDVDPTASEKVVIEHAKRVLGNGSTRAVALVNGNKVVWSGYVPPATQDSLYMSYSVGKTVTSMAVGQSICAGALTMATRANALVPELNATDLGNATLQNLLEMSSGTWEGYRKSTTVYTGGNPDSDTAKLIDGRLTFIDVLTRPQVSSAETGLFGQKREPGEVFAYRSTDPLVLGVMINRSVKMKYTDWVQRMVLDPAGVQYGGVIGEDRAGYGWSDGNHRFRIQDWIRFAWWVKQTEMTPGCMGDFVRSATHKQISNDSKKVGAAFNGYGYLVWTDNTYAPDTYWAVGYGGQRIGWSHKNNRMTVVFSVVEDQMLQTYSLFREWAALD